MDITIDLNDPAFNASLLHEAASDMPGDAQSDVGSDAGGDGVWALIRDDARRLAVEEPLLAARLTQRVLRWERPTDMLAATLASRLCGPDLTEAALCDLFREELDDGGIMAASTRDISAVFGRDPGTPSPLHVLLNQKGFHALQLHRICHALWHRQRAGLALALASDGSLRFGVDIHPAAVIGDGVMLDHATGIVIGETAVVGNDVSILQSVTLGGTGKECGDRHPKVGDGVLIGAGAKVLGNIQIGRFAKVAAGSVVLTPVPAHCTVAGVPAKIVRRLHDGTVPGVEMCQSI